MEGELLCIQCQAPLLAQLTPRWFHCFACALPLCPPCFIALGPNCPHCPAVPWPGVPDGLEDYIAAAFDDSETDVEGAEPGEVDEGEEEEVNPNQDLREPEPEPEPADEEAARKRQRLR
eukprot:8270960-Heterocapsa_arctica.AAC.1